MLNVRFETFSDLVTQVTSGPIVAMELMGEGAICKWQEMVGPLDPAKARADAPLSIRARFGTGKYAYIKYSKIVKLFYHAEIKQS